jgi:hypothetical protein
MKASIPRELVKLGMLRTTNRTAVLMVLLVAIGCGTKNVPVHGTVAYQGQPVDAGLISFVPIEDLSGPVSRAMIRNGQYEIAARGGLPVGKHRVEVSAQKKTGRKITEGGRDGTPQVVDELAQVGPANYAGPNSPLTFDATKGEDGRLDIEIPSN